MSNADVLVPLFGIIFLFGAPVVAFIVSRVLRHQERMEMLRRGIVPPPDMSRRAYRDWRRAGGTWPPPGAPHPQAPPQGAPYVQPAGWSALEDDPQRALMKGIRLALIGFGLTLAFGMAFGGYRGNPILLGGLIPMFVGIAQIIIAVLSGATLPGVQPRVTFYPPPGPPGPGAAPPPPPPSQGFGDAPPPPWAQQPGRPRFEELSKPVPPPDLR